MSSFWRLIALTTKLLRRCCRHRRRREPAPASAVPWHEAATTWRRQEQARLEEAVGRGQAAALGGWHQVRDQADSIPNDDASPSAKSELHKQVVEELLSGTILLLLMEGDKASVGDGSCCPICLQQFCREEESASIIIHGMHCNHLYHSECLLKWCLQQQQQHGGGVCCCVCRQDMFSNDEYHRVEQQRILLDQHVQQQRARREESSRASSSTTEASSSASMMSQGDAPLIVAAAHNGAAVPNTTPPERGGQVGEKDDERSFEA